MHTKPVGNLRLARSVPAPDHDCPRCRGKGFVPGASKAQECNCILKQRALAYLTPTYGPGIAGDPAFRPEPYLGKDVVVANPVRLPVGRFGQAARAVVKAFLLTTGMRLTHRTLTPYDVFRVMFD